MNAFKKGVMEICAREGLYQVDLLNPAKEKITEKEYRAKLRGEKADPGFKTELGSLRSTIKKAMAESDNETMFRKVLMEKYGIVLTESRGRWGYKTNGNRTVRGRRLGANYEKEYVLAMLGYDKVPTGQVLKGRQKEAGEGRSEAYEQYLKLKAERDKMAVIKSNLDKFSWRGLRRENR